VPFDALPTSAAIVAAVAHREFRERRLEDYVGKLRPGGIFTDVKCQADAVALRALGVNVWRL
jgi:UDP-N-acetyl-D-galactosamine dehydrogenase